MRGLVRRVEHVHIGGMDVVSPDGGAGLLDRHAQEPLATRSDEQHAVGVIRQELANVHVFLDRPEDPHQRCVRLDEVDLLKARDLDRHRAGASVFRHSHSRCIGTGGREQ